MATDIYSLVIVWTSLKEYWRSLLASKSQPGPLYFVHLDRRIGLFFGKTPLCLWISLQTLQAWIGWDILYQYSNSSSRHSVKINTPSHPPRRQLWFGWLQILIFLSPSIRLHSENMTVANNWNRVSSESSMPMRSETLNILLIWFLRTFSLQHVLSDVQTSLQIHSPSKIQLSKNGPHHWDGLSH